jgi:FkbM family methyltransferase
MSARKSYGMWSDPPGLVYDVGMNNGDDSAYYLAKGLRVVGIDANPHCCASCEIRFAREITLGLMTVVNVGIGADQGRQDFFVNTSKDRISTFLPEKFADKEWAPKDWEQVTVSVERLSAVIAKYGAPHFIKLDIEHLDNVALLDLQAAAIRPPFLSAEAHSVDVHSSLCGMGYEKFKVVSGFEVADRFSDVAVLHADGTRLPYGFEYESSGPFGDDLPGPWLDADTALAELRQRNFDWVDLHAAL